MIRCGSCKERHSTVQEVKDCYAYYAYLADEAEADRYSCSICDGRGHGYPGGRPCPLEESPVARWEDEEDERRAAAFGHMTDAEYEAQREHDEMMWEREIAWKNAGDVGRLYF